MASFWLLMVFLVCASGQEHGSQNSEEYRQRFVKIVQDGQRDALNYHLPTDASKYRGSVRNCFWNPFRCFIRRDLGTYDFIVIGSGAAGSAIANRLSEEENFQVLLLEAGNFESDFIDIPAMAFYAMGTDYNWAYTSIPQNNSCLGMVERRCQFQRGRGIGGTTLINGLVYSRGSASDYDRWGALGNPDWSYEKVLPFFKKAEHNTIPDLDEGYHGTGGNVNVEHSTYTNAHLEAFLTAHEEIGYPILDYNGREHLGASRAQFNTKNGRRDTAGAAYIKPAMNRPNLHISTDSYVTRINISPYSKSAYGVEFTKDNLPCSATIRNEIILSAGAIASPQILMLSGVGPAEHLGELGIPLISDLRVGDNLQDHIVIFGTTIETNTSIKIDSIEGYVDEYLKGTGPYTLPGNNAALAFYKTNFSKYDSADLELLMVSANRTDDYFQKGFAFTTETADAIMHNLHNPSTFTIYIYTMHPDSVGTVRLKSTSAFDYPLIDPRFLDNEYDLDTLYYGIELAQKLLDTEAYKKLDARFKPIELPNCREHELFSKAYWYCFIKQTSDEVYHPVGTCKMGPRVEDGAVVDSKFQVYGVTNLRVADASVIPFSMVGHTSAPSTMIGERCADFIKRKYNVNREFRD
ncbi:glucose dehydrogenase [FAD, quinone]-like [Atheta coriaria]|uniref:glucose dehydrogenase [FAD, quinone]-like n=1 Tax=Dalotia coriaria TaxID=877792 RepID=UPI0031F39F89